MSPTVFSEVDRDMRIAQEEIFGPVLSILPYDSVEEGIETANQSRYGRAGGVWAKDRHSAIDVARRLRAGQISVNGGGYNIRAPLGGYKESGNGREGRRERVRGVPGEQGDPWRGGRLSGRHGPMMLTFCFTAMRFNS